MKRINRKMNMLGFSLPLISIFVCNFLNFNDKSFCQAQDFNQSASPADSEDKKIKVMAARNSEINSLLAQAINSYKHKRFEEAINLFDQVIRLDPQNAPAHFSLGIALEANKDFIGASNHYETAHEIDPANNEYQKALITLKAKIEKQQQAQLNEAKQKSLAAQAAGLFKMGQYEEALSLYKTLDQENPHLAFAKYNMGTIYLIFKKPEEALGYYKEANKLEPKNKQYADSLEKLKESIKETRKPETSKKSAAEKVTDGSRNMTNQAVIKNILEYCGLRVKSGKNGVIIEAILTGSRAAQAGLQPGDIVEVVDGRAIKKSGQLEKILQSKPLGQRFQLLVIRAGRTGQILF